MKMRTKEQQDYEDNKSTQRKVFDILNRMQGLNKFNYETLCLMRVQIDKVFKDEIKEI